MGNLFWTPLAMCIGKRPVILISMLMFLGGLIWSFYAPTLNSLLGARIFASFAAGSIESLGPSIIADMFFERYFATAMALFSLFLTAGSQVGPVIAGYLIFDKGWRWFFKLCAILNGINFFFCLFFLPETTYRRAYIYDGETAAEADKEATEMVEHQQGKVAGGDHLTNMPSNIDRENAYAGSYFKDLLAFKNRGQEERGMKAFPKQLSLPWRFLLVPGAVYAAVSYGVILGG